MDAAVQSLDFAQFPLNQFYIGGQWVPSTSVSTINLVSPNTDSVVAAIADASHEDVDRAVKAASEAFKEGSWRQLTFANRADWLRKLSAQIKIRQKELALAWTVQIGLSFHMSEALTDFYSKALDSYAEIGDDFASLRQLDITVPGRAFRQYEPVGVVAAIAPWNAPLATMLNKIGPALLAGCSVVMKPAPQTPIEAYIIAQCAHEIDLPAGVLNLIVADRAGSAALVEHPSIDKVSFTGSLATGKFIARACSERIARCSLELGGKSAAIILSDYDLEQAAATLVEAICTLNGQNCTALSRVLIDQERHDAFADLLATHCQSLKIGGAFDPQAQLGSLATEKQLETVERLISVGLDEGATLVTGGKRRVIDQPGYFIEPTVFANVDPSMTIAQEEVFGPVLAVISYDSVDEAIAIADNSKFALAGAVFTNDRQKAMDISLKLRTGTMGQNRPRANYDAGFGGFKQSGIGREGGLLGLLGYLETKTILVD